MKPRESVVRLKMFQVRERRREIAQLDMVITEFERMMSELEAQIVDEERQSGNSDVCHFAYSTFAHSARKRYDNLKKSIRDLQLQKENAEAVLKDIEMELQHVQVSDPQEGQAALGGGRVSV
ncbi:hypothetical protein [Bartonella ancashensis]|uniref:Flagellar protein FliJ n=1 Tax=Bartonella ancashensis TaxID=1318743 RepID=A0A0M4LST7_9HYPH|nr:hypothetical protein [Bartonella ancashensis]ALE03559.1 Flagellar protein FliJ [Bartonella ancashensis]